MADKFTIDGGSLFRQEPGEPNKRIVTATDDVEIVVAGVDGNAATIVDPIVAQVPVNGSIQDALDAADGSTPHIVRLAPNTIYTISAALSMTAKTMLDLNGSTIRLADDANANMINAGTPSSPTDDIAIGNGRLDGNRAGQTNTELDGIELHRVTHLRLWNLAVDNVSGIGIFSIGNDVPTRWSQLVNVSADNNLSHGIWFGNAMRMVQYSNIEATGNGGYGVYLDHSEAQANGIYAHGNALTGIYIRNVRACSFTNLTSVLNGEHGILVERMLFSIGATWQAHNNGQSGAGFADVYFDDQSDGYGATHRSQVHGITVGLNLGFAETPITDYGVYVEDGLADRQIALTGIAYSAGTVVSNLRLPATSTGLVVQDYPAGTPNTRWERGNVLLNQPGAYLKLWATNTSVLPAAATAESGAVVMDGQKKKLSLSTGTEWRDIALIDAPVQVSADATVPVGQTLTVAYLNTGSLTVTLPSPGLTLPGERYTVKNIGSITVTVATAGSGKTIDGATTVSLPPYAALIVVPLNISGTINWYIVGGNVSA